MIDLTMSSGAVRLSPSEFDALIEAAGHRIAASPPEALPTDRLVNVILNPAAELRLVVAGPDTRVEHRVWLAGDVLVLLLGVRPEVLQLMTTDAAFLTATLVRLTRMRPRHLPERAPVDVAAARFDELVSTDPQLRALALTDTDADFAWRLDATSASGIRTLTAVDGDGGLRFAYPDEERLVPVTNTFGYRVLSTVLLSM